MVDTAQPATSVPPGSSPQQLLNDRRAPSRDSLLDGLAKIRAGQEAAAAAAQPPAAAPAPAQPAAESATPAPAETQAPEQPATPAETPAPATPPAPETPAEPPGLAQVRKAEQHMRKQLAEERARMQADFAAREAAWTAKLAEADALKAKVANPKQDPIAALTALGFSPDTDFDALGRLIYAHSPEGRKDPANAAAAAAKLGQTETKSELQEVKKQLADLQASLKQRDEQAAAQARVDEYLGTITKAVGETTPLAKSLVAKNPARAKQQFLEIAHRLYNESSDIPELREDPSPAEVLKAYEDARRAELADYGIDLGALTEPQPPAAPAAAPAPARPATTIAPAAVAPSTPPAKSGPPDRDEVLAQLAKMRSGQA